MERLRFRRGGIKSKITRISKFIKDNPLSVEDDKAESTILYQGKLDALLVAFNDFVSIQKEICKLLDLADPACIKEYEDYTVDFEDDFYSAKAQLTALLAICGNGEQGDVSINDRSMIDQFVENQSVLISQLGKQHPPATEIKLLPLKIPQFNGEYRDWTSFFDIFNAAVHQNKKLSNAQKMQYLKESLTGSASQLIKHITIADANYVPAYDMLVKRFDKKPHVVISLIKTFMEQAKVSTASSTNIREVLNIVLEVTRSLAALGADYESRDPWLIFLVLEKLDSETRKLWSTEVLKFDNPKLTDLLDFMEIRCDSIENFCEPAG